MSTTSYVGTAGNDIFNVDPSGNSIITTGAGSDDIVVGAVSGTLGTIVVTDFDPAHDVLDLSAYFSDFAHFQAATAQQGANVVIQLGGGGTLTLDNVSMNGLGASDFSFSSYAPIGGGTVTGTAAHHYTVNFQGVLQQYTLAAGGATVNGGPEGGTDTLVNIQRIQFVDGYMAYSPSDTAGEIYRLYEAALGRAPDPEGLAGWANQVDSGVSLQSVASSFVTSTEFQNVYGSLTNTQFVTLLYSNVLHRLPDAGGLSGWLGAMSSGETRAQVLLGFTQSTEDTNDLAAPVQQGLWVGNVYADEVARLYDTTLSRLPDLQGLAGWTQALQNGSTTLLQEVNGFMASAEFQATYGNLSNSNFITLLYENALHRVPDQAGLAGWVNALNGGESRAQVVLSFSESAEHIADTAAHIDYGIWIA